MFGFGLLFDFVGLGCLTLTPMVFVVGLAVCSGLRGSEAAVFSLGFGFQAVTPAAGVGQWKLES